MTVPTTTAVRESVPRDEVAERVLPLLAAEPQSAAALGRTLDLHPDVTMQGLRVLEARHQAKRTRRGWVPFETTDDADEPARPSHQVNFPYEFSVLSFDAMFVDADYQRPLTSFVRKIEAHFDPVLFQTLVLSDRGPGAGDKRYAIIDGQTRWVAAQRVGVHSGPSIVFQDLSPEDEASIFYRLQKERRGVVSWHRFRAQLASGETEAQRILELVEAAGYKMGSGKDELRSVAALESCYRTDDYTLERTLIDLKAAWPDRIPEGSIIRGMHYFLRNFPIDRPGDSEDVDDELLVRRLKAAGVDGLERKKLAAKELGRGSGARVVAHAIQSTYTSRS